MFSYGAVIRDAWAVTVQNPKLKWFAFFPTLAATTVFVLEVVWQVFMYLSEFGANSDINWERAKHFIQFLSDSGLLFWVIALVAGLLFFQFFLSPWITGAEMVYIEKKIFRPDDYISLRKSFVSSFHFFFRLVEFQAISTLFSIWSIALFAATFYRFFHGSWLINLWPGLMVYTFFAIGITILFSYVPQFVVLKDFSLTRSVNESIGMSFAFLGRTIGIIGIMILIGFRVIINVAVAIGIPVILLFVMSLWASKIVGIVVLIVGIFLLVAAAYLTSILEIFSQALWIRVFQTTLHEYEKK